MNRLTGRTFGLLGYWVIGLLDLGLYLTPAEKEKRDEREGKRLPLSVYRPCAFAAAAYATTTITHSP